MPSAKTDAVPRINLLILHPILPCWRIANPNCKRYSRQCVPSPFGYMLKRQGSCASNRSTDRSTRRAVVSVNANRCAIVVLYRGMRGPDLRQS
jgi:hypothetical protein